MLLCSDPSPKKEGMLGQRPRGRVGNLIQEGGLNSVNFWPTFLGLTGEPRWDPLPPPPAPSFDRNQSEKTRKWLRKGCFCLGLARAIRAFSNATKTWSLLHSQDPSVDSKPAQKGCQRKTPTIRGLGRRLLVFPPFSTPKGPHHPHFRPIPTTCMPRLVPNPGVRYCEDLAFPSTAATAAKPVGPNG